METYRIQCILTDTCTHIIGYTDKNIQSYSNTEILSRTHTNYTHIPIHTETDTHMQSFATIPTYTHTHIQTYKNTHIHTYTHRQEHRYKHSHYTKKHRQVET